MTKKPKKRSIRFRTGFSVGDLRSIIAEEDQLLAQYYVGGERYLSRALNRDDSASVFVGPKGVGKSAILQMVRFEQNATRDDARLIEVAPDDLAFNALINIDTRTPLLSTAGRNHWLFTSLWDYVLAVAILEREAPSRLSLSDLLERLLGGKHKSEQRRLLKLALNDDGSVSTMTDKMLELVRAIEIEGAYGGATGKVKADFSEGRYESPSTDLTLLQLVNNVAKALPKTVQREYFILIDDLDLHWTGSDLQNAFLGSMFLSIRKLSRSRSIKFVVSMRESIYRDITLEERDKFNNMVCRVEWSQGDIRQMLESRISTVVHVSESNVWGSLFPPNAFEEMWSQTNQMPREMIDLSTTCVELAIGNREPNISSETFNEGSRRFSEGRIDELASAFLHQYPELKLVVRLFAGGPKEFPIDQVQEVAFRMAEIRAQTSGGGGQSELGHRWLRRPAGVVAGAAAVRFPATEGWKECRCARSAR